MKSMRLSIVEDITEIREGLKYIVSQESAITCVETYATAQSALEGITQNPVDIVIMDIHLPDGSGLTCMQQIKENLPDIQFMIFTIYEDSEQIFEALRLGANGYLLKSTTPSKIIEALTDLYQGGAPMSAAIAKKVIRSFQPATAKGDADTHHSLSTREQEVLILLSKGLFYKEIAEQLHISIGTVRQHIHHIYKKLQVQNRTEALNKVYGKT